MRQYSTDVYKVPAVHMPMSVLLNPPTNSPDGIQELQMSPSEFVANTLRPMHQSYRTFCQCDKKKNVVVRLHVTGRNPAAHNKRVQKLCLFCWDRNYTASKQGEHKENGESAVVPVCIPYVCSNCTEHCVDLKTIVVPCAKV